MIKKYLLFLIPLFLFVSLVSAGSCTKSGYKYCWETTNTYGDATAKAKIYWQFEDDNGVLIPNSNAIGNLYIKAGWEGTDYTVAYGIYNAPDWDNVYNRIFTDSGNRAIMNQFDIPLANAGNGEKTKLSSSGKTFTKCLVLVAVDTRQTSDYYSWTYAGYGWTGSGNCLNINVVESEGYCASNLDCPAEITKERYCEGNTLKEKTTENQCKNNQCIMDQTSDNIIESCDYSCGEDDDGIINCLNQPTITVYRLENSDCTETQIIAENKKDNDYDTLEECQENISKLNWTLILWTGGIIGVIILGVVGYIIYKRRK